MAGKSTCSATREGDALCGWVRPYSTAGPQNLIPDCGGETAESKKKFCGKNSKKNQIGNQFYRVV